MTTTDQAAAPTEGDEQPEGKTTLGRVLDGAGIIAGAVLIVIVYDVVSGGKVTRFVQRRLARRRGEPCEGCDDDAPAVQIVPEGLDEH